MKNSLIVNSNVNDNLIEQSKLSTNENLKKTYQLSSLTRIGIARFIDLFIVGIFQFLVNFFVKVEVGNWINAIIVMSSSLLILISYFIIIPLIFKGNTFGKFLLNIRLRSADDSGKIKWYALVIRELNFWFIPWMVGILSTIIAILVLQTHQNEDGFWMDANLIYNLGYVFFVIWYLILFFSIKVQKNHQSGTDLKFNLYVVDKNPLPTSSKEVKKIEKNYQHTSLTSMPGNFDTDVLSQIVESDLDKFNKTINLTDLAKKQTKLGLEENLKKIATDDDKQKGK